jgi:C4-type Zn-finger protein
MGTRGIKRMSFQDGEETGNECPKCGAPLLYEMSFRDCFSHTTGHYTIDVPLIVCSKCDYCIEDIFNDEEEEA